MNDKTSAVHFGNLRDSQNTIAAPIYQSSAFEFESAEHAASLFRLEESGNIYTRLSNPTNEILEKKVAKLEGGALGVATSSGQAAIFYAVANLCESGDNIVVSNKLYGGTITLFYHTLKRFGIESRMFDSDDLSSIEPLIDERSKVIFFETLSNPQISMLDIEKLVEIAKKHRIVTVCDNTVATPVLCKPLKLGVDIVVHSTSKYICGQGLSIGGIVVEREGMVELLRDNPRYTHFNEPDMSYHGLVYTEFPMAPFCFRIRLSLLRDIGAVPSPFNSWTLINGLETLSIRMDDISTKALKIAEFLNSHPKVNTVRYPGLPSDKYYALAQKYLKDGKSSGLISFDTGDFELAKRVLNSVNIFKRVVNIGDSKSIITHPASTTHQQLSDEQMKRAGITKGQIRLSIGLEDVDDLIDDIKQALES